MVRVQNPRKREQERSDHSFGHRRADLGLLKGAAWKNPLGDLSGEERGNRRSGLPNYLLKIGPS